MTRWSANHRTRRSRSALAYGEHSTAAAATTSPGSYTTNGDATRFRRNDQQADDAARIVAGHRKQRLAAASELCLFAEIGCVDAFQ